MISNLPSHIHLRPEKWHEWLQQFLSDTDDWDVGQSLSVEKRPILTLSAGEGELKIVIWSQMHGNEATGTYAISDVLTFLAQERLLFDFLKKKYRIIIIPMLNPDGAERFTRFNALGSDLNREGLKTISPETALLKNALNGQVAMAFNLHDQRTIFSVGQSAVPASLSLLAPSTITSEGFMARQHAMRLISSVLKKFSNEEFKHIARFSDEYYPRAMGEWCIDRGIPTILVEAGGYCDDVHRTFSRKLTTTFLLHCLELLVYDDGNEQNLYQTLPVNAQELRDLILRNVRMQTPAVEVTFDISFMTKYLPEQSEWRWVVDEIGDLNSKFGYKEANLSSESPVLFKRFFPGEMIDLNQLPKSWIQWFTTI